MTWSLLGSSRLTRAAAVVGSALALVITAACGSGGQQNTNGVIEYWLWDSGQQPGYQNCADNFAAQNPGLRVHITQIGWTDYWSKLTSGFIAGTAPDVFTDTSRSSPSSSTCR